MNASELYAALKPIQEAKGNFFNPNMDMTLDLLGNLLINKERYGYMACPCRLASGDYQADKDIICPCVYREADVQEYGCCFCGLYVSAAWNEGSIAHASCIPDRRPPEKVWSGDMRPGC